MELNPPNANRWQIQISETRQTQNVNFRFMPNAFQILKPIQRSSKRRLSVSYNAGVNAFAKKRMRLAYEDKRDLYCMSSEWAEEWWLVIIMKIMEIWVNNIQRRIISWQLDATTCVKTMTYNLWYPQEQDSQQCMSVSYLSASVIAGDLLVLHKCHIFLILHLMLMNQNSLLHVFSVSLVQ